MAKRIKKEGPLENIIHIRFADYEYRLLKNWSFAEDKSMASIVRELTEEKLKGMEKVLTSAVIAVTVRNTSVAAQAEQKE